ncbi:secretion-regulating guanine nucleotide exchange factor isoform X2 [Erpetoichthys calabaricus]|uniref:secretion-regulating guanine nucleotide exchange factor isoform X2 n=1 Tax=Erpetoichthys calabaricus TaxID=27687 RepID=UPI002233F567|nr:secretion-regulating guanine nucleotide exchange factor isoform X2 [Erpetoichthys calabaricus]
MTAKKELRGGLLFAWGANSYGQLGLGHKEDVLLPVRVTQGLASIGNIKCLVGGGGHSAIITELGELLLCGHNHKGQLGMGHKQEVLYFCCCPSLQGRIVVQVACGWDFTLILTDDGTIWTCGSNAFGQLGLPQHLGESTLPLPIETLNGNAVEIAAGLRHALAVTEKGLVFQWGVGMKSLANRGLQTLPVPAFMSAREPYEVPGLGHVKVKHVSAGAYHSACITDEGCLFVWGSNKYGQLPSSDDFLPLPFFIQPHHFEGEKVTLVCSGWTHMVARTEKGQVYTCGRADYGQLGRKIKSIQDSMCKSNVIQSRFTPEKVSELTGASQEIPFCHGVGTSTACVEMEPKSTFVNPSRFLSSIITYQQRSALGLGTRWLCAGQQDRVAEISKGALKSRLFVRGILRQPQPDLTRCATVAEDFYDMTRRSRD